MPKNCIFCDTEIEGTGFRVSGVRNDIFCCEQCNTRVISPAQSYIRECTINAMHWVRPNNKRKESSV